MGLPAQKRRSPSGFASTDLVLSAHTGSSDSLFPQILSLYVSDHATIADTTYGKGVFWRDVPTDRYDLRASDLSTGTDARQLPYASGDVDCVVFDPPYTLFSGSAPFHTPYLGHYNNQRKGAPGHDDILRLYFDAAKEAHRVLNRFGTYIVKCQDEVHANRQYLTHVEVINHLSSTGWVCEDLFVLVRKSTLGVSRMLKQIHGRKAHSYFLIFRKEEAGRVWPGPRSLPPRSTP